MTDPRMESRVQHEDVGVPSSRQRALAVANSESLRGIRRAHTNERGQVDVARVYKVQHRSQQGLHTGHPAWYVRERVVVGFLLDTCVWRVVSRHDINEPLTQGC